MCSGTPDRLGVISPPPLVAGKRRRKPISVSMPFSLDFYATRKILNRISVTSYDILLSTGGISWRQTCRLRDLPLAATSSSAHGYFGVRSFAVAGPRAWDDLPGACKPTVRAMGSVNTFKASRETFCFDDYEYIQRPDGRTRRALVYDSALEIVVAAITISVRWLTHLSRSMPFSLTFIKVKVKSAVPLRSVGGVLISLSKPLSP